MYGTVPTTAPSVVSVPARVPAFVSLSVPNKPPVASFASPKSSTFTRPSGVIMTFAGFRSRWTMPFSCAAASASASAMPISQTLATGSPPGLTHRLRLSPSTSSIAMKRIPSASWTE